ncbi:unnamed protein product [Hymenolepis diminuta]|uniref:Proteasome activator complex subunit 4 C-terminal domain-containing protein n=1 Tax=Hymenolepis diminuta TaxID=6216 RepID=A0A3P6ZK87_HYMDI|nr:unnamed protein product [Hymenolepis diminuta]
MNLSSELSPNEITEWQEGIKAIAEFFADPDSWIQLSHVFLNYHQCSCRLPMNNLKLLIQFVLLIFGPHPYLRRVEEFAMTLLQPALTPGPKNDRLMIVGSATVSEILFYVTVGSRSWPRDMKLELFGRVLPRLIVYAEVASQRVSRSVSSTISPPILPSLSNISLIQPTKCDAATTTESNSCFQEGTEDSPASCRLAYRIRYGDWGQDRLYIFNEMDFVKFSDPCGPNIQIRFPLSVFLRNVTVTSLYLPLLVRDFMAVLLLKDVLPSAASFALQNELLSKAAERITPATEVISLCSIIQAHTSYVPDYLPEVITEVAKYAIDPHPIGQIAVKTVNEYYHHVFRFLTSDDQRKFSVKQVEIIESYIYRAGYFI